MKKSTALAIALAFIGLAPASWAIDFCDSLQEGRARDQTPDFPPATVTTDPNPPDTGHLWIQIRTTQRLDTVVVDDGGETLEHRCAIASDLVEVDMMMAEIGFDGHDPGELPLLDRAYVEYVAETLDQKFLQDLVAEVWDPNGQPNARLDELKENAELYTPEVLNLYYVHFDDDYVAVMQDDFISTLTGFHIRADDGKSDRMIFVSDASHADTLAHEFGHALSAAHVNFWDFDGKEWCAKYLPDPDTTVAEDAMDDMSCEFSRRNYMWAGSDMDRQQLGEPQKQRMMYNIKSVIKEFSDAGAANELDCPDFSNNPEKRCTRLKGF